MRRFDATDGLIVLGLATTATGLGLIWLPLGVIAAGMFLTLIGMMMAWRARAKSRTKRTP